MEIVPQSLQQTTFDQYHQQLKSSNKDEMVVLIKEILENPSLNTFSEFLHLAEIEELKTGENERIYNTLNLFAFGTYQNYLKNKESVIPLTPIMEKKLKHLTVLTLATQRKTLPYDELMIELDIKNVRHLEDLVIEAFYAGLINGKLDQKNRQLEIDYAVARDIQKENIQDIIDCLQDWLKSCESCSNCLQEQIENANSEKAKRAKHKEHVEEQLLEVKKNIKKQSNSQPQNFEEEEFLSEKNLNTKGKMRPKGQGTSKGVQWFKNF